MAIKITDGEVFVLRLVETAIQNAQAELGRLNLAKESQIALLEIKYQAKFNPATGQLVPEKEEEKQTKWG